MRLLSEIEKAIKKAIDELLLYRSDEFKLSVSMDTNVMAVEALQEKLERDKGCAYCDIAKNSPIVYLEYLNRFGFLGGNTQVDEVTRKSISHCPMCGRKLVE